MSIIFDRDILFIYVELFYYITFYTVTVTFTKIAYLMGNYHTFMMINAVYNLRSLYVAYLLYFNENTQPLHIFSFAPNSPRMVLWGMRMI